MDISQTKDGDVVVIELNGSLNTQTSPKLDQVVKELLEASERLFVVDFKGVDFIASAGLRVLLMLAKRLKGADGGVSLCAMNKDVKKVFTLSGFDKEFTIAESRKDAIARLPRASAVSPIVQQAVQALMKGEGGRSLSRRLSLASDKRSLSGELLKRTSKALS